MERNGYLNAILLVRKSEEAAPAAAEGDSTPVAVECDPLPAPVECNMQSQEDNVMATEDVSTSQCIKWTRIATKLLLDYYKTYRKELGTQKVWNMKKMWELISDQLQSKHDLNVNPSNCENRWRVLERNYRKYIDNYNNPARRRHFEFAEEMYEILGTRKNTLPELTLSADTISRLPGVQAVKRKRSPSPESCPSEEESNSHLKRKPKRKVRSDVLERMRNDKKAYYEKKLKIDIERLEVEKQILEEKKLKIDIERLEVEKQILEEKRIKNRLIQERNEILKAEKDKEKDD